MEGEGREWSVGVKKRSMTLRKELNSEIVDMNSLNFDEWELKEYYNCYLWVEP